MRENYAERSNETRENFNTRAREAFDQRIRPLQGIQYESAETLGVNYVNRQQPEATELMGIDYRVEERREHERYERDRVTVPVYHAWNYGV